MKQIFIIVILFSLLTVSCYEPYFPEVVADKKVLVVNGLITNEKKPYQITLSYAASFSSTSAILPLTLARIDVTDNHGNRYFFRESGEGVYVSDPLQFTGVPGNTYTLHIETREGWLYESSPQFLPVADTPGNIYAEYDYKETISKQDGSTVLSHGANILADIENKTDSIPRFRFTSHLVTQYFYTICPMFQACYLFYCWQSEEASSDINLTGGDYAVNSASIYKHEVCFIKDDPTCYALVYGIGAPGPNSSINPLITTDYQNFNIHNRLLYLNLYRLNNESYSYYRSMDKQLSSDGKLFDPIAVQIDGNIKCLSNPQNKAFGYFEASSLSSSAFSLDFRNLVNGQPSVKKIQYVLPPESTGCRINAAPAFWVF